MTSRTDRGVPGTQTWIDPRPRGWSMPRPLGNAVRLGAVVLLTLALFAILGVLLNTPAPATATDPASEHTS